MDSYVFVSERPSLLNQINEVVVEVDLSLKMAQIRQYEYLMVTVELKIPVVNNQQDQVISYCLFKEIKVSQLNDETSVWMSGCYPGQNRTQEAIAGIAFLYGYFKESGESEAE